MPSKKSKRKITKAELEERVKKLEKELKEKEETLLRSYADFQNYKRRVERDIRDEIKKERKRLMEKFVDIYDLLKRVEKDKNPKKGVKAIIKSMEKVLKDENIEPINAVGSKFDHKIHYAVSTVGGDEDDIIVDEIKKGYMIDGELLRPSFVVVSKKEV